MQNLIETDDSVAHGEKVGTKVEDGVGSRDGGDELYLKENKQVAAVQRYCAVRI
jgi:hypothetical protein